MKSFDFEVRCGNHTESYASLNEAIMAGTSATIIIDHGGRKVYAPEIIENTFRGEFFYSPKLTGKIFAQEIDWVKMRRQLEDRLRKDPTALRFVCGELGIDLIFK